jgi:trafficking protein particle complex subunit 2
MTCPTPAQTGGLLAFSTIMPPPLRLQAVAFVSPQNHPILVRTFAVNPAEELKYHYLAHTSLDVFEERSAQRALSLEDAG